MGCPLSGYQIKCGGRWELHHILNRGKARGNSKVQKVFNSNPPELTIFICSSHNVSRWADTSEARAILMYHKLKEFGWDHMRDILERLPWKTPKPEFRLEAIMVHLPPTLRLV